MARGGRRIKTIVLGEEAYQRLEGYKLELIKERGNPRVTFDQAVNSLLDEHERRAKS